jgi:hypothetical protein
VRVAFVGQRTYIEPHVLESQAGGVTPTFHDHRDGADFDVVRKALDDERPDLVVVFRPDTVPAGALADLPAPVLGVATEPLPRAGRSSHVSLDFGLAALAGTDRGNVDRLGVCGGPRACVALCAAAGCRQPVPDPAAVTASAADDVSRALDDAPGDRAG